MYHIFALLCPQRVEEYHLTRSSEESYKQDLEAEQQRLAKVVQEMEAAMFTLKNANACLITRLHARDEELVRDLFCFPLIPFRFSYMYICMYNICMWNPLKTNSFLR